MDKDRVKFYIIISILGRNDKGQLGHCDNIRRDIPTRVETLKDHIIVSASCGRGHTLFLSGKQLY